MQGTDFQMKRFGGRNDPMEPMHEMVEHADKKVIGVVQKVCGERL